MFEVWIARLKPGLKSLNDSWMIGLSAVSLTARTVKYSYQIKYKIHITVWNRQISTAQRYAGTVYAVVVCCVRLSVRRLSQSGTVPKRINVHGNNSIR